MRCRPIHHSGLPLSICSRRCGGSGFSRGGLALGVLCTSRAHRPRLSTAFGRAYLVTTLGKAATPPLRVVTDAVTLADHGGGTTLELAGALRHSKLLLKRRAPAAVTRDPTRGCLTSLPAW